MYSSLNFPYNISQSKDALSFDICDDYIINYKDNPVTKPAKNYSLIIHKPDELPMGVFQYFSFVIPTSSFILIEPEMHIISKDFEKASLEKRKCYLRGERKLKYFKVYTKNNCEVECVSMFASRSCGCVPFDMIRK